MSGRRRWWTVVPACLGAAMVLLVTTAHLTLLDSDYDARAVAKTNAYERIYTEVVPAPAVQRAIHDALDQLATDPTLLTANVRLVLPPDVLEQVVQRALRSFVRYLFGATDRLDTRTALEPLVANVNTLIRGLLPGLVSDQPVVSVASVASFRDAFRRYVIELQSGRLPSSLPTVPVTEATSAKAAEVVTQWLDEPTRDRLRSGVETLIRQGNLTGAITLVTQAYFSQDPGLPDTVLRALTTWSAVSAQPLTRLQENRTVRSLRAVHGVLPLGYWSMALVGSVLLAGALTLVALAARRRGSGLPAAFGDLAVHLGAAALFASGVGYLIGRTLPDPLRDVSGDRALPPALRSILFDVDRELRAGISSTYLQLVLVLGVLAAACALVAVAPWLRRRYTALASHPAFVTGAVAGVVLIGLVAATPRPPRATERTCNGYAALCDRTYDAVTYLAAHNAMAASDEGFINAAQDPDVVGQLDNGVRALLLDLHYWTTPAQAADFIASLPPGTRSSLAPSLSSLEYRPGVWLCHVVCQLGAARAVDELTRVAEWLDRHPDAVVTLILEDHVMEQDVQAILERAGLRRFAARPPDFGDPWPTLGTMVRTNHRLMVFTEQAHSSAPWLNNFYDRAAETPFRATSPSALSCAPGRGPRTAALFLLNHWVSATAPSRALAAQVNPPGKVLARVQRCERERGMRPTYIAVDFAQIGNPLAAVNRLNGVG